MNHIFLPISKQPTIRFMHTCMTTSINRYRIVRLIIGLFQLGEPSFLKVQYPQWMRAGDFLDTRQDYLCFPEFGVHLQIHHFQVTHNLAHLLVLWMSGVPELDSRETNRSVHLFVCLCIFLSTVPCRRCMVAIRFSLRALNNVNAFLWIIDLLLPSVSYFRPLSAFVRNRLCRYWTMYLVQLFPLISFCVSYVLSEAQTPREK